MDTVGPLNNRQETYPYYQLPFCPGTSSVEHHHETLGEALQGMDLINSGIPIRYLGKWLAYMVMRVWKANTHAHTHDNRTSQAWPHLPQDFQRL